MTPPDIRTAKGNVLIRRIVFLVGNYFSIIIEDWGSHILKRFWNGENFNYT